MLSLLKSFTALPIRDLTVSALAHFAYYIYEFKSENRFQKIRNIYPVEERYTLEKIKSNLELD